MNTQKQLAENLLQIKAIKLSPANPFTWASGWKSPIYCDNRKTLSYPEVRNFIKKSFVALIREKYSGVECIAGVATGAIGIGALVADMMELPFVYVRSKPKDHGLTNLIEGEVVEGRRTVVVEDLISTGRSSLNAVAALRDAGMPVAGMVAIFTYDFPVAAERFREASCELHTLTDYHHLLEVAVKTGYVEQKELETLQEWRKDPGGWREEA
jgi:orotate phosphoribosyltransferase